MRKAGSFAANSQRGQRQRRIFSPPSRSLLTGSCYISQNSGYTRPSIRQASGNPETANRSSVIGKIPAQCLQCRSCQLFFTHDCPLLLPKPKPNLDTLFDRLLDRKELAVKDSPNADPVLENFFAQLSPEIAATFTDDQVQAIARVFAARQSRKHPVDIRLSLPLLRCYIVVLAGRERRSVSRLQAEKVYHPIWTPVNTLAIAFFFALLVGSWAGILYGTYQLSHYFFSSASSSTSNRAIKTPTSCEKISEIRQNEGQIFCPSNEREAGEKGEGK